MTGFSQFINIFGDVTVVQVAEFILAAVFLWFVYRKFKDYLVHIHDLNQEREEKIQEALNGVRKYPEYRQQSIEIQKGLNAEIKGLKAAQTEILSKLLLMEESEKRSKRNKLRDKLLQCHRYYTNPQTNPLGTWTSMEAETFWEYFREYEDMNGNGLIHGQVQSDMEKMPVIDIGIQ